MQLTVDEKEQGGLALVRGLLEAGATPEHLKAYIDALDTPDEEGDDQPQAVAAEKRGRMVTLPTGHQIMLEADGGFTLVGEYPPVERRAVAAYLRDHPIETSAVVAAEERVKTPFALEDAIPGDRDLSAEELQAERRKAGVVVYGDEHTMERLIEQEKADKPAPRRQAVRVEQVHMAGELPLPGNTLSAEDFASVQIVRQAQQPLRFSGEQTAEGAPIPA